MASDYGSQDLFAINEEDWRTITLVPDLSDRFGKYLKKVKNKWTSLYKDVSALDGQNVQVLGWHISGSKLKFVKKKFKDVPNRKSILKKLNYVNNSLTKFNLKVNYSQLCDLIEFNEKVGELGRKFNENIEYSAGIDYHGELANIEEQDKEIRRLESLVLGSPKILADRPVKKAAKYVTKMLGETYLDDLSEDSINYALVVAAAKEEYEEILDDLKEYLEMYAEHNTHVGGLRGTLNVAEADHKKSRRMISNYNHVTDELADIVKELGLGFKDVSSGSPKIVRPEDMPTKEYDRRIHDFIETVLTDEKLFDSMEEVFGTDFIEKIMPEYVDYLAEVSDIERRYEGKGLIERNKNGFFSLTKKGKRTAKNDLNTRETLEQVLQIPPSVSISKYVRSLSYAIGAAIISFGTAAWTASESENTKLYDANAGYGILDEILFENPDEFGQDRLTLSFFDLESNDSKLFNNYEINNYSARSFWEEEGWDQQLNGESMSPAEIFREIVDTCENVHAVEYEKDELGGVTSETTFNEWEHDYGDACTVKLQHSNEDNITYNIILDQIDKPRTPMSTAEVAAFFLSVGLGGYALTLGPKRFNYLHRTLKTNNWQYIRYLQDVNKIIKDSE